MTNYRLTILVAACLIASLAASAQNATLGQLAQSAQASQSVKSADQQTAGEGSALVNGQAQRKKPANPSAQPLVQAEAFLASLSAEQKDKTVLPFDSEQRVNWHFIPMPSRKGLPLMEMEAKQQMAALNLLRSCLSPAGFEKAQAIMELERVLKLLEGQGGRMERNPVKYYFTVFGAPAAENRWGLSIEGHHLSLNFVLKGNRIIDSTPQFFASNPAALKADYGDFKKGAEVLKPEEQLGFQLVNSLSQPQITKARLPGETPGEILSAGKPQPPTAQFAGLSIAEMDESQQEILRQLLTAYTSKMKRRVAQQRWQMIEDAGWESVSFAWSGGLQPDQGHYYVVQGPTFLVEFINVQPDAAGNPANHIHCVWRDRTGDFDLSAQ